MAKINEKYAYLDRLSTEQLEELLRADIESPENSDEGVIFHILEVIEQRKQMDSAETLPNVDQAWKEFQQYYKVPEGKDQSLYPCNPIATNSEAANETVPHIAASPSPLRSRRIFKHSLVAAIAFVALLGGMVVAQAAGIDVFGMLGRWTEETFSFVTNDDTAMSDSNTSIAVSPEHATYYEEIQAALSSIGITDTVAPSWYPDGFDPIPPRIASNGACDTVATMFSNEDDRHFLISITQYNSSSDLAARTFEKDPSFVEQYTHGTKTFYIFSNINGITATWADGLLLENISGDLTMDELKTIIDSIGGL